MPDFLKVHLNGVEHAVKRGTSVASALLLFDIPCRESVTGMPRAALCGMGICFECRAEIDGKLHRRSCQIACEEGMQVRSQR